MVFWTVLDFIFTFFLMLFWGELDLIFTISSLQVIIVMFWIEFDFIVSSDRSSCTDDGL